MSLAGTFPWMAPEVKHYKIADIYFKIMTLNYCLVCIVYVLYLTL